MALQAWASRQPGQRRKHGQLLWSPGKQPEGWGPSGGGDFSAHPELEDLGQTHPPPRNSRNSAAISPQGPRASGILVGGVGW